MPRMPVGRGMCFATLTALCALATAAAAQDMPPEALAMAAGVAPAPPAAASPAAPPSAAEAPVPGPAKPAVNPLSKAQLEQLVAPIALYPDPVLSQVLMASTYPLEIVEADRWARIPANQGLTGTALTDALKQQNWDPSVKALAPFPRVLALLAEKLDWTEALGNAFLAQQADVMDAVQGLRHDAMAAGNLKVTPQCHCIIQTSGNIISILPSDNSLACIPVYNARVAYGAWPWPDYPPYYFPEPPGFAFEPGFVIGFWPAIEVAAFGPFWGWAAFDWGHHDITVDRARFAAIDPRPGFAGNVWVHDPAHRGGVGYRDPAVTSRFGAARAAALTAATAAGRASFSHAASGGAAQLNAAGHVGGARSAGRFGGTAAAAASRVGGHFGHANFASARVGHAGHFGGGGAHVGGGRHFGGGGPHFGGGHVAHAQFSPRGGGPHFSGGGPHFGGGGPHGGGGSHGGGGGGGPHGGGGGPHGGGGGGGHHH